jgi:TolA-binding protein
MALLRRWLLILSVLGLGGGQLWAASGREARALAAATAAFQDQNWDRAEMEFTNFIQKYPASTHVPHVVLMAAQAQFKQGQYAEVIALLSSRAASAGGLADDYTYWLGEAQFAKGDFTNAAETFSSLAKNFPGSPLRLTAVVEAAAAYAQFHDWPRHDALLEATNGVFARAAQLDPDSALVINGRLSLAQSKAAQSSFAAAGKILELLNPKMLAPEQDWERLNLLYQVQFGLNDLDAARVVTTNLMQSAKDAGRLADSVAMLATVLEKKNQSTNAIAAWSENLTNTAPVARQREAILKIAALAAAQNDVTLATTNLENYLAQFPNSPGAELALLTLGELYLKAYAAPPADTNQLAAAQAGFDQFLGTFTNSPLAGRAYLDRGWCEWLAGNTNNSLTNFEAAARQLPPSEGQAVAKFKTGDAMFALANYAGALENYRAVLDDFTNFPIVGQTLGGAALFQRLRTDLKLGHLADAEAAMQKLLRDFPASEFADNGQLLLGEAFSGFDLPEKAREVFQGFVRQFPGSPLAPQAELAAARTYEREQDWPAAITNYDAWLKKHPTNDLLPQVQYSLGLANYHAGRETNAFQIFTAFVTRFPTNDLAPLAQWWVADHFFRLGGTNLVAAEQNYENIFQNTNPAWKNSTNLFYSAQLMASRAAVGRQDFPDAANYLTQLLANLLADTNSSPELKTQARFAYGDVLMQLDSLDTNHPFANFELATNVFTQICLANPTNESGALAWGELAKCQLQLLNYAAATNAFAQAFNSPYADVSARSEAKTGFGLALEKIAATLTGTNRIAALRLARDSYLDVFDTWTGKGLRNGEAADPFWVKKAGLLALPLGEALGLGDPDKFIDRMEELFPQLKDSLEKKRAALAAVKN